MQTTDTLQSSETLVSKLKESTKQLTALARTLDLDHKRAAEIVPKYMLDLHM